MKTIGLIGGMSWESSLEYYRLLNETVKDRLGQTHSAECIMYSVDFAEIEQLQHDGNWNQLNKIMIEAARRLERGGAKLLLICTNTMHKMADLVQHEISIPLVHIADATGEIMKAQRKKKVGLLGTRFTMEQDFYRKRIKTDFGIDIIIPSTHEREIIHSVIYDELCQGQVLESSRKKYIQFIKQLEQSGAEGVILGCTEIPLLINQNHVDIPVFDTTRIHVQKAVEIALSNS